MQAVAPLSGLSTLRDYCQLGELRFIASHESHSSGQAEIAVCTVYKKPLPLVIEVRIGVIHSRLPKEQPLKMNGGLFVPEHAKF